MNKYKSDDYKLSAVKYYLNNNDSLDKVCSIFDCKKSTLKGWVDRYKTTKNIDRPSYLCRETSNQSTSTSVYNQTLRRYEKT